MGLSDPLQFLASIDNFGNGDTRIDVPGAVTSDTFANNHLKLYDNRTLIGNLNIIGDFNVSQFVLNTGSSGTGISYNPNPASAALPAAMTADHSVLPALTHG